MKVYVRLIFADLDPFFDFATSEGPHIEMDLDVLPVEGGIFYLTPLEQEDIVNQYKRHSDMSSTAEIWKNENIMWNYTIEEMVGYCCIVSCIAFTYNIKTNERYVLIDLKSDD